MSFLLSNLVLAERRKSVLYVSSGNIRKKCIFACFIGALTLDVAAELRSVNDIAKITWVQTRVNIEKTDCKTNPHFLICCRKPSDKKNKPKKN